MDVRSPWLSKASLKLLLPASTLVVCLIVGLFATLGVGYSNHHDATIEARGHAHIIARAAAADVVWRETRQLDLLVEAFREDRVTILDADGTRLAGVPSIGEPEAIAPIFWEGEEVGSVLVDPPPIRFMSTSIWATLIVALFGTAGATMLARYYGVAIARSCEIVADAAEALGPRRRLGSIKAPFAEFARMRTAVSRAARRFNNEFDRLERAAYTDLLTGLPNRTRLAAVMDEQLRSVTPDQTAAFIQLRIDGVARATESLGTAAAKSLQTMVSQRIADEVAQLCPTVSISGERCVLASLGSDEFGVFAGAGARRKDVSAMARSLKLVLEKPFKIDGRAIMVGLTGGIAMAPDDGDTTDELMRRAELALSQVRAGDQNRFEFYTPRLDRVTRGRDRLETELREAIATDAFSPVFQPKIDFKTGSVVGAEALARWDRGEGRSVAPSAFIPLAEEIGLIDGIGDIILRKACVAAAEWVRDGHDVSIAVNVSPQQFERDAFTDQVLDAVRLSGLPPKRLELEITETMAVSNPDRVLEVMHPLRAMGVKLAVDDFGTGHANLSMLTRLPFDTFKIDRQFVMGLQAGGQGPAIVEMILAMAETLGLQTVAEGVETEAQADFLRRRGCTLAQGFLYSAGIGGSSFLEFLRGWDPAAVKPQALRAV